jgi:CubicO group peptidase (beta-lactamase class C family)
MRRIILVFLALGAVGAASFAVARGGRFDLGRAAGVATGFVSHQLCSAAFVAGLDPVEFYAQAIEPTLGPAAPWLSHRLDRERREVSARFAGLGETTSTFRGAAGCLVMRGIRPPDISIGKVAARSALPPIAGPGVVTGTDPDLDAAITQAFAEPQSAPHRWTKAVVVAHQGHVVAERYAPGYGVDTPILGWSMTKSVTNALIGILVGQGKLAVDAPAPVTAWSSPSDPRHAITVDQLLRMESGLDIGQSLTADATDAFNPASQMLFDEPDTAAFAARAPLKAAPGTLWDYTNGNTQLLAGVIREKVGGSGEAVLRFARDELFAPVGMEHVTLELDAAGTPIGSSFMWASPRDWARLGLLYLGNGVVGDRRILPEQWAEYSARPTPSADRFGYGAGFWTNRSDGAGARRRTDHGMPGDSYMARGTQGQYVVIVPSRRLVVVRMGYSADPYGDVDAVSRLVGDVVAILDRR